MTAALDARPDPVAARLLDAAARRFVAAGVRKTTMAEIAAEAGVSKPTLYARFPDKAAVVGALVRRETADFTGKLTAVAAAAPAAPVALEEAFVAAVRWLDRHPFVRKSLDLEPDLLLPLLTEPDGPVLQAGLAAFAEVVRRGVAAGELRPVPPELAAEVCWRLVLSYVLLPAAGGRRRTTDLRALVRETLLGGLLP